MNQKQRTMVTIGGFALALIVFFSAVAFAGPLQDRMKARLPEIVSLKSKGVIGENSQGYL
jgi:hypothetical protein